MAGPVGSSKRAPSQLGRWLLKDRIEQVEGPGAKESQNGQHP